MVPQIHHKWYAGFDWEGLIKGSIHPPLVPTLSNPEDTTYFAGAEPSDDDAAEPYPSWNPDLT